MIGSQFGKDSSFSKNTVQTTQNLTYYPSANEDECARVGTTGPCAPQTWPCNMVDGVEDWVIKEFDCGSERPFGQCPKQKKCAKPDCAIGMSSLGVDPVTSTKWNARAPNLTCVFNADAIDTLDQYKAYTKMFGEDDSLMTQMCERPSDNCAPGLQSCTTLREASSMGDLCRAWYSKLPEKTQDVFAQNACYRYSTDDCRCVNRTASKEYNELKINNPIVDSCWFVPCANPSKYFVPHDIRHPICPQNLCEIILNIYKDRDVKIYQNDIVCDVGGGGGQSWVEWLKMYWPLIALLVVGALIFRVARA